MTNAVKQPASKSKATLESATSTPGASSPMMQVTMADFEVLQELAVSARSVADRQCLVSLATRVAQSLKAQMLSDT